MVTPSPEEVKEETNKAIDALEELVNEENPEVLAEKIADIVEQYILAICDLWVGGTTVSGDVMNGLAEVEKQIAELNAEAKVLIDKEEGMELQFQTVENALLSVPEGGYLYVKSATLEDAQKDAAKALGVTEAQLTGAESFDMTLLDKARVEKALAAPIKVTFVIPDNMKGKVLKVVHYGSEAELLDVTLDGNSASVVVTSCSEFALVAVADIQQPVTPSNPSTGSGTGNTVIDTIINVIAPKMGDNTSVMPWLIIAAIGVACAAVGVATQRRKKNK